MPLGFPLPDLATIVAISFAICTTVCALAMEAAVIFTPAFVFVFPALVTGWPALSFKEAVGLSLFVEFFGYTSSVSGYWYRGQIDFDVAAKVLVITVPMAVVMRVAAAFVPQDVLMLAFGLMLAGLAGVLFQSHRHGARSPLEYVPYGERFEGRGVTEEYAPRTALRGDGGVFGFDNADRSFLAVGGAMAGLVGIAIGEIANTVMNVRKRLPIKLSTGTSALVLHVTILAALLMTLALMRFAPPSVAGHSFSIPLQVGAIIAPVVVIGGQVGSYLNARLTEHTTLRILITAYFLVGTFVVIRVIAL